MNMTIVAPHQTHPMWQPQVDGGAVFDDEVSHLVVGWPNISHQLINKFQGHGKFGMMNFETITIISLQFDASFGICIPYHASLIERTSPPTQYFDHERRLLTLSLVEAKNGEIKALRTSTISPHLSQSMFKAFDRQASNPITDVEFIERVNNWSRWYPTNKSVVRASIMSRLGE